MLRCSVRAGELTAAVVVVGLVASLAHPAAQSNLPPEKFRAFAVNMSGVGRTGSGTVDIVIDRWSSDAEREKLVNIQRGMYPYG